jgi:NRPS condensation-like uncharacterized protein
MERINMKIKFGNSTFKITNDGKLGKYKIKDNPFEATFSKSDSNLFKEVYEGLPSNLMSYYKDINQTFEKFMNVNKPNDRNTENNPDILPANSHDICNYVARYGIANFQIQPVLKFDSRLDFEKLSRAVRLSIDVEPVFGCRFIENDPPYWKRLDNLDKIEFCIFEETDNPDVAVKKFLESPLDMDNEPKVKVKLIRSGQNDTLVIKINHAVCDGAGAKEYVQLLSEIYSSIDQDNDAFVPKPRIGGRKDQDKLFSTLGIKDPKAGWNPLLEAPQNMWSLPLKKGPMNATRFVVCSFPPEQLDVIYKYGKARGATINDLILTAYYRALFEISNSIYGIPMDISLTIDLRRYLPDQKTEAIRNFSGGFNTRIARIYDEPFEKTLSRVVPMINKIKKGYPGLQNAIGGECIEKMSFSQILAYIKGIIQVSDIASQSSVFSGNVCSPGLSNLGFISKPLIKFGESTVTEAYVLPPVVRAPGFLLLACTYNDVLTLTAGYYKDSIRRKNVERLLNKIKDELITGCR